MNEVMNERKGCAGKVVLVILFVIVVIAVLWATGLIRWEDSSDKQIEQSEVLEDISESAMNGEFTVSESEWHALKHEVRQLRQEIEQLKSGGSRPAAVKSQPMTTREAAPAQTKTEAVPVAQDPNAVSIARYSHDWIDSEATVALKTIRKTR